MTQRWPRIVAHADMDAFYASVEQLDDPALRGRALVVGPNSHRGVCLTASYEARQFGVRSAMPMAEVRRRCPDVLVVPPHFERYQAHSETIMRVFNDFSPRVEAISLDEAFLEMSGAEGIFGAPSQMAHAIRQAVFDATGGLTASVGIASTKYVAKVASDFNKPNGVTVVPPQDAVVWLDPMPVSRLWGAGPKTVPRLERLGLYTIGDVRRADPDWLRRHLGSAGMHFRALAHAEDPRRVARRRVARSMGSDRTLNEDVSSRADIERHLRRSADRIGRRLRDKHYRTHGVRVKLKTNDFRLLSRQVLLPEPTDCSEQLFEVGASLLDQFDRRRPFRLVGLAAYDLVRVDDPLQLDLFASSARPRAVEQAIDELIAKFGSGVVVRAEELGSSLTVSATSPNLDFVENLE
ncbi:MAG: DNA polymerase IV [Gammaproteobacteria bacterium]|nr:DNA polymerase IV [Gammaproteobacteria bacterium]